MHANLIEPETNQTALKKIKNFILKLVLHQIRLAWYLYHIFHVPQKFLKCNNMRILLQHETQIDLYESSQHLLPVRNIHEDQFFPYRQLVGLSQLHS